MEQNNKTWLNTAIICATILIGLFILSRIGLYIKDASNNQLPSNLITNTISVDGEGRVFAKPDTLLLSITISEVARTTKEAQDATNKKIDEVQKVLSAFNVKKEDIQTSNLSIYPEYSYENNSSKQIWFRSNHQIDIKIKQDNIETRGSEIVDAVAWINGAQIQNISYDITDKTAVYSEARKLAMQKAEMKAKELASLGNVKLQKPISISEQQSSTPVIYPMARNVMSMDAKAEWWASTPSSAISAGQLEFILSLTVIYSIQ